MSIWVWLRNYVKNLKSLSNADSNESFSTEPLNRERDAGCDAPNCSVRFKYTHSCTFSSSSSIKWIDEDDWPQSSTTLTALASSL